MLTRFASFPGVGAPLAAVALAILSLLANGADDRVRLDARVLDQSRGHNMNKILNPASCNSANGADTSKCDAPDSDGESCSYCTQETWTELTGQGNGNGSGYTTVAARTNCGALWWSFCDGNRCLKDDPNYPPYYVGICNTPYTVLMQSTPGDPGVGD